MKKILLLLGLVSVFIVGCGSDPIAKDIENYLLIQMKEVFELESKVVTRLNSVLINENSTEEELMLVIDEVYPEYNSLIAEIEVIMPSTRGVKEIHDLLIDGHTKQFRALLQIQSAYYEENTELMYDASEEFAEGKSLMRDYSIELSELAKKHNVALKKNNQWK